MRESIPTEITGARKEDSLLSNPITLKESKMEMYNYFKGRQFILETLTPREAEVFSMYYGLGNGKVVTFNQVGEKLNLSAERIRQILAKALRKLRHPSRMNLYMVLTDEEVGYNPSIREKYLDEEYFEEIEDLSKSTIDTSSASKFNVDILPDLRKKKLADVKQKRYNALSKEEQEADKVLQSLLKMSIREFIETRSITGIDINKLIKIIEEYGNSYYIISLANILEVPKSVLEENVLQEVIAEIKNMGLHFEEEAEYIEDFNKMCYSSMIKVGLDNLKTICPIVDSSMVPILDFSLENLDMSVRTFNCLKRAGKDTIRDLVMMQHDDFLKVRNLGKRSYEEILAKIRSLGFDICPDDIAPEKWVERFEKKSVSKKEKLPQKKLNINEVPEDYRKAYAIGTGLLVEQEIKDNLMSRVINTSGTKTVFEKPIVPKVKFTQEQVNEMSDKQVLKAISEDISVIHCLETSFIVKYKKELIKMILADASLDVEKRFDILQLVNEANVDSLLQ